MSLDQKRFGFALPAGEKKSLKVGHGLQRVIRKNVGSAYIAYLIELIELAPANGDAFTAPYWSFRACLAKNYAPYTAEQFP